MASKKSLRFLCDTSSFESFSIIRFTLLGNNKTKIKFISFNQTLCSMQQKFVEIGGLTIAYQEKNSSSSRTIFFIHGNSGSSLTWSKQLESSLFSDFRLIAFDMPAHGMSNASSDPGKDYSPVMLGKIMAEAVNNLAADHPYILIGFSFGTNIIGEMLCHNLKPAGIILAGSCVIRSVSDLQTVFLPNPNGNSFFNDPIIPEALEKLALDCFYLQDSIELEKFKNDFENTKRPFRSKLMEKASAGEVSDEIGYLKGMNFYTLIVFGKEDKLVNVDYLDGIPDSTWKKKIHKLQRAGHFVHVDQSDVFNQLVSNYVIKCLK